MKIFITEEEATEIKPVKDSDDKAIVITPYRPGRPSKEEEKTELEKKIIAFDTIAHGNSVAPLHDISKVSANNYANGVGVNDETRLEILQRKYDIEDKATTKLMDMLDLIEPKQVLRTRDQIALISGLSQLVDRISSKKEDGRPNVHLHLYGPHQKKEKDYEIIDA